MEKDRLIERLNYAMRKKEVLALADQFSEIEDGISTLFALCQSDNEMLSFHSAWVLENVLTRNPELFSQCLSRIIIVLPDIKSPSLQRHFCKLINIAMEFCNQDKLPKDTCKLFLQADLEPVVEVCFEWLMNPVMKPAVKVHCLDILLYLSGRYDWIKDELPHVIELMMIDGTPGIRNKGQKTLTKIRKTLRE